MPEIAQRRALETLTKAESVEDVLSRVRRLLATFPTQVADDLIAGRETTVPPTDRRAAELIGLVDFLGITSADFDAEQVRQRFADPAAFAAARAEAYGSTDIVNTLVNQLVATFADEHPDFSDEMNRTLNLFMRNYVTENLALDLEQVAATPEFAEQRTLLVTMLEAQAMLEERDFLLNPENAEALEEAAAEANLNAVDYATRLTQASQGAEATLASAQIANRKSVAVRTFDEATNSDWISGRASEPEGISDRDWNNFLLSGEFDIATRDWLEANRDTIEESYKNRSNRSSGFLQWTGTEFQPELQTIVDRHSPVSKGFHPDPILDPLITQFVSDLPVLLQPMARDRLKEFIQSLRMGPNKDKAELWGRFVGGDFDEAPRDVLNDYVEDLLSSMTGGPDMVANARLNNINLLDLADNSISDPTAWIEAIGQAGAALGLPPVGRVNNKQLNLRAFIREMFADDKELAGAPAFVRNQVFDQVARQLSDLGFDPLTEANQLDYALALANTIGTRNVKDQVLKELLLSMGEPGERLWSDIQARSSRSFSQSVYDVLNEMGIDPDTLLADGFTAEVERVVEGQLGPSPAVAAFTEVQERLRFLPTQIADDAARRIQTLLDTFPDMDPEEILARTDVQERIDLIIDAVGRDFIGESELVQEVVDAFGGLNEFFRLNENLRELSPVEIQEFITENSSLIFEQLGPDTDTMAVQKELQRALQDKRRQELQRRRDELSLEAEERQLEFEESPAGRELRRLEEQRSRRAQFEQVFAPELRRAVEGRIVGPAAQQVLADIGPGLTRQFVSAQEGAVATGATPVTPTDFLAQFDDRFFRRQRVVSGLRREPTSTAAPVNIRVRQRQQRGVGFDRLQVGI